MRRAEVAQLMTSLRARLAREPPGYQFTIGRAELEACLWPTSPQCRPELTRRRVRMDE